MKDPSTRRYYRFGETEALILRLLDGSIPLDSVRERVERAFNAPLPPAELEGFVERLRSFGLIEEPSGSRPPRAHDRRVRGSFLYLRFKAFDPDKLLDRMVGTLGFLFTPRFVVASGLCLASAIVISIANRAEIARDLRGLYNLRSFALAWVVLYAVIVVHEFAHGLTCKRFGGSVRELGFMLIFLQPAFYCNVSDAWLFPEKSRRLWVTFSGAYVEMVLWALATFVWWLTDPRTVVSQLAMVVMATSAIKTLINLNPLIKLDGYYLLSDSLEIANLRQKSMTYLWSAIRRLFLQTPPWDSPPTPREARIFLLYGVVAGIYSAWLLGYVALWFGGFLMSRYQAWGFVLFACLVGIVFRAPIDRTADTLRRMFGSAQAARASISRAAKILAVVFAAFAVLWLAKMELKVAGDFTILPAQNADVRADVEGIIEEIRVDEGDRVAKGDLIARLSDRDTLAEIDKVKAQIEESEARLRLLRQGARAEELSLARTSVEKAEERLKYARDKHLMAGRLLEQRLMSQKDFAEAEEEVSVRQKELEEAEGRLKMLKAGSRPEEIQSVEAETRRWEVHLRYLEDQLQRISIVSPIAGVITTQKLKEKVGEHVDKGDLVAKVYDVSTLTAEIAVPEKEISDVRVGQEVEVRARSLPQRTFHGTVASIAPTASVTPDAVAGKTILVTTRLANTSALLKPEMTGSAKIHCGRVRVLSLLSRRISRTMRVDFWSWW